jgi:peptide-methionine (R)-S-oxide reductase
MSRLCARFFMCLAVSTFLAVLIGHNASGQESRPGGKQDAGDDSQAAAPKTGDGTKDAGAADKDGAAKDSGRKTDAKSRAKAKSEPEFVRKTDAEWRKILTKTQYMVTRQKATEPAFSGKYATGHFRGTFVCVCCDAELFNAQNKFESGTGWPSFDRPANARAIGREMDYSATEPRVEVMCRRCGAHLGHVFDDGPTMTTLRFCINSAAIKLRPPDGESATPEKRSSRTAPKSRTKARAKASTKTKAKMEASPAASETQAPSDGAKAEDRDGAAGAGKPSPDQGG